MCGDGLILAKPRGRLLEEARSRAELPTVGDFVLVRSVPGGGDGVRLIERLLPRRSVMVRKAVGGDAMEQVIAANVDVVFLVTSLNLELNERRIERYLAAIWESGAVPVILLTKVDLDPGLADDARRRVEAVAHGVALHVVSSFSGVGLDDVRRHLGKGRTGALVGSSGVGKSTLINALLNDSSQSVQAISEDGDKGRHTTTGRTMFLLPEDGGILIDTPGMREFMPVATDGDSLARTYGDVEDFAAACKFGDCRHGGEPGCAVAAALADGSLDAGRWEGYQKQQREQAYLARKQDVRAASEERKKWKKITKEVRRRYKD